MLRTTRRQFGLVVFTALSIIFNACASDEEEDNGGLAVVDTGAEDDADGAEESGAPDEADASEDAEEDPNGNGVTPEEALAQLDGDVGAVQVVYEWHDAQASGSAQLTIAHSPPDKVYRVDTPEGTFQAIYGSTNVMCVNAPGEGWQCLPGDVSAMAGQDPFQNIFDNEDLAALGLDPATTDVTTDEILGRSVICIHTDGVPTVSNIEFCLDRETGVMLRNNAVTDEGPYSIEAISISDPDPSLFEPPAEVMQIPTG